MTTPHTALLPVKRCKNTPSLIEDASGNIFIQVTEIYDGEKNDKARTETMWGHAAHIVKCVNERDTLLRERDALREALTKIANCGEEDCEKYVRAVDSIAVEALVATAGGGDE